MTKIKRTSSELTEQLFVSNFPEEEITPENIRTFINEDVDQELKKSIAKYDRNISFNWKHIAGLSWQVSRSERNDYTINIPITALLEVKKTGQLSPLSQGVLWHEITHLVKKHGQQRKDIYGISEPKNPEYYKFRCKNEWEADEGIPNDPEILKAQADHYENKCNIPARVFLSVIKQQQKEILEESLNKSHVQKFFGPEFPKNINEFYPKYKASGFSTHPTDRARADRFAQRVKHLNEGEHQRKIIQKSLSKKHIRTFFGPELPFANTNEPHIRKFFGVPELRSKEGALALGFDPDYYPSIRHDSQI